MTTNWITKEFLKKFSETLHESGFVTNEHRFTPYRQAIIENVSDIQDALKIAGISVGKLNTGEMKTLLGTLYYVYDEDEVHNLSIKDKVLSWAKEKYELEKDE